VKHIRKLIVFISYGKCIIDDDGRLQLEDGDLIVSSKFEGMRELNDGKPRKVMNDRPYYFHLQENTSNLGHYEMGIIVTQVKKPKILNFKTLKEALENPRKFLLIDLSKFYRPTIIHLDF
jgi:ubiquitin-activating enzyme E1